MRSMPRALAFLAALLVAAPLAAQSLTGTVAGTVTDEQGGALPGVTVTLTGKTGAKTATTQNNGGYRFVALDPGTYSVQTALTGFSGRLEPARRSIQPSLS